jgi:hypothetical protein
VGGALLPSVSREAWVSRIFFDPRFYLSHHREHPLHLEPRAEQAHSDRVGVQAEDLADLGRVSFLPVAQAQELGAVIGERADRVAQALEAVLVADAGERGGQARVHGLGVGVGVEARTSALAVSAVAEQELARDGTREAGEVDVVAVARQRVDGGDQRALHEIVRIGAAGDATREVAAEGAELAAKQATSRSLVAASPLREERGFGEGRLKAW